MGIVRIIFYILMIIVSSGVFIYTVIAGSMTWMKASDAGILQFHKIFSSIYYLFYYIIVISSLIVSTINFAQAYTRRNVIAESMETGIQAFQTYEETEMNIADEETYLTEKIIEYQSKANRNQQNVFFYLFMSMLWCAMMILNTGFITEKGYYAMGSQKPRRIMSRIYHDKIYFYLSRKEKPILILEDNQENRNYFAALLKKTNVREKDKYVS